ncbi:MAG: carbohydrate-binding domain-containing protein [Bacteroidales bacterium]|nr:carbohydrate-binding domain-containing protein [Bacteroidales bacterium]
MKKMMLFLMVLAFTLPIKAQEILHLYNNGSVIFEKSTEDIDSIYFRSTNSLFSFDNDLMTFSTSTIDSITFSQDSLIEPNEEIRIIWDGDNVTIINPMANQGVSISNNGGKVTVTSTANVQDLVYHLSGSTSNGYLYFTPNKRFTLSLDGVSITNPSGPAIDILVDKAVSITTKSGTQNYLNDGSNNSKKATLQSKGQIIFHGTGTLTLNGNVRNAIHSDDFVVMNSGNVAVASAVADGIHCDYFIMNGGHLTVTSSGDGIDGDSGYITINDGTLSVNTSGANGKGLKCDSTLMINGGDVEVVHSGNQSKGIKSAQAIFIHGGTLGVTSSGTTVLESTDTGNDPSYCSAISCNGVVHITGGDITINLPTSNAGGRGISADDTVSVTGGTLHIETHGNGAVYTVSGNTKDSYTSACIKSDVCVKLTGGDISCTSTGTGGKGINSKGSVIIGDVGASDSDVVVNITTSGAHITVSSGGGWWGGGEGEYANPKGIKADGELTINGGTVTVNCTQTTDGGECLSSAGHINIHGGQVSTISAYDDAIQSSTRINITGGTIYAGSNHNDGIDCNGRIYISGGFIIASATTTPEESFDTNDSIFSITGGTMIGTAPNGMFTNPTASACTQHSLKYTGSSNNAVQIIRNSDNTVILTFKIPSLSGGGGGPGGWGGSSNAALFFSSPELIQGSYTLKYGGTINGGTDFHNYYTGATYSGGSNKSFTVGSGYSITTVQ